MDNTDDRKAPDKFAGVADKLNAPKKLSQFERARQEAEQKRLREEAEAAEALREFEDSFAVEDDEPRARNQGRAPVGHGQAYPRQSHADDSDEDFAAIVKGRGAPSSRRQDVDSGFPLHPPSGGPRRGSPPSLKRKREMDDMAARRRENDERGHSGSPRPGMALGQRAGKGPSRDNDDYIGRGRTEREAATEDDPAVRRPTMLLQSLPRNTTEESIRMILPPSLKVEEVKFLAHSSDHSLAALVIAHTSTPVSEINTIVTSLQNRYLGFGHYLNITRHVSTSSVTPVLDPSLSSHAKNLFGATTSQSGESLAFDGRSSLSHAPPPASFGPPGHSQARPNIRSSDTLRVSVTPPSDIKLLKLIHSTAEKVVLYGATFEALLMSRPEVQKDEKWAWLYDSSSKPAVYYRWLVWRWASVPFADGGKRELGSLGEERIFSSGPLWMPPEQEPKFQDVVEIEDLAGHADYVSSSEGEGEEEQHRPKNAAGGKLLTMEEAGGDNTFDGTARYLNPYRRAKLVWLFKRLPDNMAVLRAGDVARVTDFVVANAGNGAEEVVDLLLCNVERPLCYTVRYTDEEDNAEAQAQKDMSGSQLVALYIISDVLLASATSGVRDAWKYRSLFETAIKERGVFERLGRLERELGWGKMKGEQWKRKIVVILDLWYSANVFTSDAQKLFKQRFLDPPLTKQEAAQKEADAREEQELREKDRWRTTSQDKAAQEPAAVVSADGDDKAAIAMQKIAAMKARLAAGNQQEKSSNRDLQMDNEPDRPAPLYAVASGRRARPTAADLIDAPAEPEPVPAVGTGFGGFSLSLGKDTKSSQANPSPASATFSVASTAKPTATKPPGKATGNMFADSDEE